MIMSYLHRPMIVHFSSVIVVLLINHNSSSNAALLLGLGDLAGGSFKSNAGKLSDDGSIVVGTSESARGRDAFRWDLAEGMQDLGALPPGSVESLGRSSGPNGVSADGSVIFGGFWIGEIEVLPFRWTAATGMEPLEPFADATRTLVEDVSGDGSIIVGSNGAEDDDVRAFRWTRETGYVELERASARDKYTIPLTISHDGNVIAGWGGDDRSGSAWLWTADEGYTVLRGVPAVTCCGLTDLSHDGSVVVGFTQRGRRRTPEPFLWTAEHGMKILDGWTEDDFGGVVSLAANADASTVVGHALSVNIDRGHESIIWDPEHGTRNLREVLSNEYSLSEELKSWTTLLATDISGDGRRIVGSGTNSQGNEEAWIAILEPSLKAGDADQDFDFDQMDLVRVQVAGKYLTGQPATWGEGDWNGMTDGYRHAPAVGDGVFDQLDIVASLEAGVYLTGSYDADQPGSQTVEGQTSLGYDAQTGEVWIDTPVGVELTSINIDSATGIFTGAAAENLAGSFDNDADDNIFKATFGGSFGALSFGEVAQAGLSEEFVQNDLTAIGSRAGGGALADVDIVYRAVPEPTSCLLLFIGYCFVSLGRRWRRHEVCLARRELTSK